MKVLQDKETATKYHLWNEYVDLGNTEMRKIQSDLNIIVFKECRGSSRSHYSIGWENGESYLQYHSGIIYKWIN